MNEYELNIHLCIAFLVGIIASKAIDADTQETLNIVTLCFIFTYLVFKFLG